jgi:hypothetical protein
MLQRGYKKPPDSPAVFGSANPYQSALVLWQAAPHLLV